MSFQLFVILFISCSIVEITLAFPHQHENAAQAKSAVKTSDATMMSPQNPNTSRLTKRFDNVQKIEHEHIIHNGDMVEENKKLTPTSNVQHIRKLTLKRVDGTKKLPSTHSHASKVPTTHSMTDIIVSENSHLKSLHKEHSPEDNVRDIYDVIHDVVEEEATTTKSLSIKIDDEKKVMKRNDKNEDSIDNDGDDKDDDDDMDKANTHGLGYYREQEWVYPPNYGYNQNIDGYNNNNYGYNGNYGYNNIEEQSVIYDQNGYAAPQYFPNVALENYGYQIKPCHKLFGCKFTKWFW